jgi:beta-RFAP synthase
MVEQPGVCLRGEPAAAWSAEGPLAERALAFALGFARSVGAGEQPRGRPPLRLVVESAAPEHAGLGTGTQLGLAVAQVAASCWGLDFPVAELARRVGRGARSGIGVHGFACGGLLVDGGRGEGQALAPLVARLVFPDDWRIVLAVADEQPGRHGAAERAAFTDLRSAAPEEALCRLVLRGLLPALAERDLDGFGEALFDYNARAGEAFAAAQGGVYAGPRVAALVEFLRAQAIRGVGQSSWGPTVFAVVGDEGRASAVAAQVRAAFNLADGAVWVTRASNSGVRAEADVSPCP